MKHCPEIDFEDLDFEVIEKEIEADEVARAAQAIASTSKDPLVLEKGGTDAPKA